MTGTRPGLSLIACLLVLLISPAYSVTDAGLASYTTQTPSGLRLPPQTIYRTENFKGPVPTTDWCSSIVFEKFSSNQFPHPLAVCACEQGLRVSYPGASIHATDKHVFASFQKELLLGHSAVDSFADARLDGAGDWSVDVLFADGDRSMRVSYGHGIPFVYATYTGGGPRITFDSDVKVFSGDKDSPTLGVTVKGRHYGLFGPAQSKWAGLDGRIFTNNSDAAYFSLAVLPDDKPQTLALFERYAHTHITDTRVTWRYLPEKSLVRTDFTFKTKCFQGDRTDTIFALYPHQWRNTSTPMLDMSYGSIRGPMKLAASDRFTTTMKFPGILPALPDKGGHDRAALASQIKAAASARISNPDDTYWAGKELGKVSNLIPIAAAVGDTASANHFTAAVKSRLEDWFTAPKNNDKNRHYFYYHRPWTTLIGVRPSYGSSDALNDHHFHYGYFIRAAAEIARTDRDWASPEKWGALVNLLIRDIACPDRSDPDFPLLRCFDPYAGHSWASGNARFGDGNNQESSSEAMNAWTGVLLWGLATGDTKIRDLGIYLYTTEAAAINAYWFDVNDDLFPPRYTQQAAGIIWGGKIDFATWFSGEPEHIVGINLLPIQSGSLYLGLYPDYVRRNLGALAELRGSHKWKDWSEIFWMYEALCEPDSALQRFETGPKIKDPFARAFAHHWISTLGALGNVNRTVTADRPAAMVFTRDGVNTYVAANMTTEPITVTFSDSTKLTVRPGDIATSP